MGKAIKKVRVRHTPKGTKPQTKRPGLGLPQNTKKVTQGPGNK